MNCRVIANIFSFTTSTFRLNCINNIARFFLGFILCIFALESYAEIYKWKDEKGRWVFGDRPPAHIKAQYGEANKKPEKSSSYSTNKSQKDLQKQLQEKYSDTSLITKVTMAVVAIETKAGGGSGFFISEDGYIITNRHVIRPTSTKQWQDQQQQLEMAKDKLETVKLKLRKEKNRLDKYLKELKQYRKQVSKKSEDSAERGIANRDLQGYEESYKRQLENYKRMLSDYKSRKQLIDKQLSERNWASSLTQASRIFKVFLKDNTELQAQLVHISKKHDLALLQIKGKVTPSLTLNNEKQQQQGSKVYAVGSPLGMRDSVTSGIITRIDSDFVLTDTQILPGNSGGPLVNEEGEVIGVNTLKVSRKSSMQQGFGAAIPVSTIKSEFGSYLQ